MKKELSQEDIEIFNKVKKLYTAKTTKPEFIPNSAIVEIEDEHPDKRARIGIYSHAYYYAKTAREQSLNFASDSDKDLLVLAMNFVKDPNLKDNAWPNKLDSSDSQLLLKMWQAKIERSAPLKKDLDFSLAGLKWVGPIINAPTVIGASFLEKIGFIETSNSSKIDRTIR